MGMVEKANLQDWPRCQCGRLVSLAKPHGWFRYGEYGTEEGWVCPGCLPTWDPRDGRGRGPEAGYCGIATAPDIESAQRRTLVKRFWSKVQKTEKCWHWTGTRGCRGYGSLNVGGKMKKAHRLSWELHFGDPGSMLVCHHCDTPSCVRPDHMFLGTHAMNNADRHRKGRTIIRPIPPHLKARGSAHGLSKLTEQQVLSILSDGRPSKILSQEFGVSKHTISCIRNGKTWRHITGKGL